MGNHASTIVREYIEALSTGDAEGLSRLLSDEFKEIDAQLGIHDKRTLLEALRGNPTAAQAAEQVIVDMVAVGNVVRVITENGVAGSQPQHRVFALSDDKIKLEVQLTPE